MFVAAAAGLSTGFPTDLALVFGVGAVGTLGGDSGGVFGKSCAKAMALNTRMIKNAIRMCMGISVFKSVNHTRPLTIKPMVAKLYFLGFGMTCKPAHILALMNNLIYP